MVQNMQIAQSLLPTFVCLKPLKQREKNIEGIEQNFHQARKNKVIKTVWMQKALLISQLRHQVSLVCGEAEISFLLHQLISHTMATYIMISQP